MTRRMLDSGIWANEHFAELPPMARLLQIGIINHADDQGRMKAHPLYLRSQIFPYDDVATDDIGQWLQLIAANDTIALYEVDGKAYLQLLNWWEYQSPSFALPSEYPRCNGWQDRVRYTGKGPSIYTCNWVAANGNALADSCDMDGKPLPTSSKRKSPPPQPPPPEESNHQEPFPEPTEQPYDEPYGLPHGTLIENKNKNKYEDKDKQQQHVRAQEPDPVSPNGVLSVGSERINSAGFASSDLPEKFDQSVAYALIMETFPVMPSIPDKRRPNLSLRQCINRFQERAGSDEIVVEVMERVRSAQQAGTLISSPIGFIEGVLTNVLADQENQSNGSNQQRNSRGNGGTGQKAAGARRQSAIGSLPEAEANRIRDLLARNTKAATTTTTTH